MKRVFITLFMLFYCALVLAYQIHPLEMDVNGNVTFIVDFPDAREVSITGNFNDWSMDKHPAKKDELGLWTITINLEPGTYEYKVVVDKKQWFPADNIFFQVIRNEDRLELKGGEGFAPRINRQSNLKINDKIYIKGLYQYHLINYIHKNEDKDRNELKQYMNQHVFHLTPELYFNDNVWAEFDLHINSYDKNYLHLWKAHLDFYTDDLSVIVYNNFKLLVFNDPLHSFDNSFYIHSRYPVFNHPIQFYNETTDDTKLGRNNRGLILQASQLGFHFKGFYSGFNESEMNLGGFNFKRNLGVGNLGLVGVFSRDILKDHEYIDVDSLTSDWTLSPYHGEDVWYEFNRNTIYSGNPGIRESKIGPSANFDFIKKLNLFIEYLYKEKSGGFFAKSRISNGKDLPWNYEHYPPGSASYHYTKNVYFYESDYTGQEFIIGLQFFEGKALQQEISYALDFIEFDKINTYDLSSVKPKLYEIKAVSKVLFTFNSMPFKILNEIKLRYGDTDAAYYNYHILFDENNFYKTCLDSCHRKLTIKNHLLVRLTRQLILRNLFWWNKYEQQDLYFDEPDAYSSQTWEDVFSLAYLFNAHWEILGSVRAKQYDYNEYIVKDLLYSYKSRTFFNPFVQLKYFIFANVSLALEYGLDPEYDEEHKDGLLAYLYDHLDKNIPFFQNAEESLMDQHFIGLKAEVRF